MLAGCRIFVVLPIRGRAGSIPVLAGAAGVKPSGRVGGRDNRTDRRGFRLLVRVLYQLLIFRLGALARRRRQWVAGNAAPHNDREML